MTRQLTINNRRIGRGHPALVIAEIGVNHDGSVERAIELVNIAADCGADAVKLQLFTAQALMSRESAFATYQRDRVEAVSPAEMLRQYELSPAEVRQVVEHIRNKSLIPLATPFSPADVPLCAELGLPAVKIASPDLVNRPLLSAVAELRRPMLISTGAATLDEVAMACDWLRQWDAQFALLHCVSSYPTPVDQTHLSWIGELAGSFGVPVGYSDHSTEVVSGALAVAAGASVIERHLTYDKTAKGPDHAASSDPAEFDAYVKLLRKAELMCGGGSKRVLEIEKDVRRVSRQSLVLSRDLQPGETLTEDDLTVQRPGTGIPAAAMDLAIGRRIRVPVQRGMMLKWEMLDQAA